MSAKVTVEEAQANLAELIAKLVPGEEVEITKDQQVVAKIVAEPSSHPGQRRPGSAKGKLVIVADDDEHLRDFEEHMR